MTVTTDLVADLSARQTDYRRCRRRSDNVCLSAGSQCPERCAVSS